MNKCYVRIQKAQRKAYLYIKSEENTSHFSPDQLLKQHSDTTEYLIIKIKNKYGRNLE